ncbi:N-acetylneuraminate synthase family protein [Prochlorococcus sp. MIT 1223]|uniref:N-acetylneuraminate synthase family protein n=1 Tax=Prochlorococcus sp. MIT 1223 TaxID=3096217 RepID=UPI002A761DDF|nr:N-acetylneuraminate synthase family protein [Prochlorococcus sp. MIT 1223]
MSTLRPKDFSGMSNESYIYVIAEIGINHNGSLDTAKELIDLAVEVGCDAVKFQKRTINIVYSESVLNQPRESPWGKTQREQKEGLEFSMEQYEEINRYCKSKNIDWFASSWDKESQRLMRRFDFPFNKIASAMAINKSFVELVASEKKPTFASTGMTKIEEIDWLISVFKKHECPLMLMYTVSTYPSKLEHLNLKCIETLKERYDLPIGYSGHEASVSPSVVAATLGAGAIERHITLDRAMYGSDQAASLEAAGFRQLTQILRNIPMILGDGEKRILREEELIASKLRYWLNE